jgi:hypothetical protein
MLEFAYANFQLLEVVLIGIFILQCWSCILNYLVNLFLVLNVSNFVYSQDDANFNHVGKEVKGRTHTFYQVLIDSRDCPYIVGTGAL